MYLFFIYMYIGKIGVLDSVFCKTKCFGHSVFGRKLSRTLLVHWKLFNIDLEFVSRIYLWILNQVVLRSRNKNWITPTPCTKLINVLIVFNQKTHWLMVLVVYIYIYLYKLYTYISHPLSYHKFRKTCRQTLTFSAISSQVLFAIALQRGHLAGRHRPTIAEVRWVWGCLKTIGRQIIHIVLNLHGFGKPWNASEASVW